jgi:hypothetical protein
MVLPDSTATRVVWQTDHTGKPFFHISPQGGVIHKLRRLGATG